MTACWSTISIGPAPADRPRCSSARLILLGNNRAQADLDAPVPLAAFAGLVGISWVVLAERNRPQTLRVDARVFEQPDPRGRAGRGELPVARIAVDQAGADLDVVGVPSDDDLILGLLEDIGYLPRLAILMDTILHRVGLHGYAIIPSLLGFG